MTLKCLGKTIKPRQRKRRDESILGKKQSEQVSMREEERDEEAREHDGTIKDSCKRERGRRG